MSIDLQPPRAPAQGARRRETLLDNARLALVGFVVVLHAIRLFLFPQATAWQRAYLWILVFVMPGLAFIAGRVSRPAATASARREVIQRYLLPYLIFEGLYELAWLATGRTERLDLSVWSPRWILWFLLALAIWRMVLPLVTARRAALALAVVAGCLIGMRGSALSTLAINRAVVFFPFFLAGHLSRRVSLDGLATAPARAAAAAVLGAAALLVARVEPASLEPWLHGTQPYGAMGVSMPAGIGLRIGHYLGSGLVVLALLAIVTRGRGALTPLGGRTLYPYLLHGLTLLAAAPIARALARHPAGVVALLAGSAALAPLLASRPVRAVARPLVEPFRRPTRPPPRVREAPRPDRLRPRSW